MEHFILESGQNWLNTEVKYSVEEGDVFQDESPKFKNNITRRKEWIITLLVEPRKLRVLISERA